MSEAEKELQAMKVILKICEAFERKAKVRIISYVADAALDLLPESTTHEPTPAEIEDIREGFVSDFQLGK